MGLLYLNNSLFQLTDSLNMYLLVLFCKNIHNKIRIISYECESLFRQTFLSCSESAETPLGRLVAKTATGYC
jgi:hypothetical protein